MVSASDRVVETLARLYRHAEDRPEAKKSPPLTVALSRQAGSRGADIARAAGERLGWSVYDHELLKRIAEEKGLHERLLHQLDERHVGWLEEMISSFGSQGSGREHAYITHLLQQFASLARAGHCVIVGRGAAHVLPSETTLRVRVVAPLAKRVAYMEKYLGVSHAEAERWVARTDEERTRFVRSYFHKNADDPQAYDLVLDSSRFSVEECAELIVQAARMMEQRLAVERGDTVRA